MTISETIEINNIIERANLLVKEQKLLENLSILRDRIEGLTQFMTSEDIEESNNLFNELLDELLEKETF